MPWLTWLTWKLTRRVVLAVLLVILAYYLVTFVQVWQAAREDDRRPSGQVAQAIIVLGAAQYNGRPTDVFKARLDHAFDLWHQGVAPLVVVTGGKVAGDKFTEAGSGAAYLDRLGVPDSAILRETTSRSSWESLAASARFLKQRSPSITRVVLVSDPFHSLRIRLIADELGLDAVTSPTRTSPLTGVDELLRFASEALRVAFGRIFGFGRLARASNVGKLVPGLAILIGPSGVV